MNYLTILIAFVGIISIELPFVVGECSGKLDYDCGEGTPRCIPSAWHCDNIRDCLNGKDEAGCNYIFCPANTFKCKSRECLATSTRCNGVVDCADGSDEAYCFLESSNPIAHNSKFNSHHNVHHSSPTQNEDSSELGDEISLDNSPTANTYRNRQPSNPTNNQRISDSNQDRPQATCRHSPTLNFTGTYRDDGNGIEGQRLYVAVELGTNQRKVFTLQEAFDVDGWSLCQYMAAKLH